MNFAPSKSGKASSWTKTTNNSAFKNRFKLGKKIGEIQNGGVYAGVDTKTKKDVAIKFLDKAAVLASGSRQSASEAFEWEFAGLKLCEHPNIHEAIDIIEDDNKVYLITQLMECDLYLVTDLCDVAPVASKIALDLATALKYVHDRNMCHRDIKPENVFIEYVGESEKRTPMNQFAQRIGDFRIKLADFGFWASTVDAEGMPVLQKTICGSEVYTAPEIKMSRQIGGYDGRKADVWSLGVTYFVVQINFPPWEGCKMEDPYYNLWMTGNHKTYWKVIETHAQPGCVTPAFKDLFTKMCEPDPTKRVKLEDVLQHTYLTGKNKDKKVLPTPRAGKDVDSLTKDVKNMVVV